MRVSVPPLPAVVTVFFAELTMYDHMTSIFLVLIVFKPSVFPDIVTLIPTSTFRASVLVRSCTNITATLTLHLSLSILQLASHTLSCPPPPRPFASLPSRSIPFILDATP